MGFLLYWKYSKFEINQLLKGSDANLVSFFQNLIERTKNDSKWKTTNDTLTMSLVPVWVRFKIITTYDDRTIVKENQVRLITFDEKQQRDTPNQNIIFIDHTKERHVLAKKAKSPSEMTGNEAEDGYANLVYVNTALIIKKDKINKKQKIN